MPAAHSLRAGDVVVAHPGDVRTVHTLLITGVDQYPLVHITWADGRVSLMNANTQLPRLYPPDAAPTGPQDTPTTPPSPGA